MLGHGVVLGGLAISSHEVVTGLNRSNALQNVVHLRLLCFQDGFEVHDSLLLSSVSDLGSECWCKGLQQHLLSGCTAKVNLLLIFSCLAIIIKQVEVLLVGHVNVQVG